MAKIKKFEQVTTQSDGNRLKWKGDIYVNSQGIFYVSIPEDLMDLATNLSKEVNDFKKFHIKGDKFYSDTLANCEQYIKQIHVKKSVVEKKDELLILYKFHNRGSYWKNEDGTIMACGGSEFADYSERKNAGSGWCGSSPSFIHDAYENYAIEFYAKVVKKTTYTGSDKIEFSHIAGGELGKWGEELNLFAHLRYPQTDRHSDMFYGNFQEVSYTEERAKFFHDLILGMCKLMDKLSCLQDDDILKKLMDNNTKLLE